MAKLDLLYARLLAVGFVVMRQAADSKNREWLEAEFELLHDVPSLIGEGNPERHWYFWSQERMHYLDWVTGPGREQAKSRVLTYYKPIWDEMQPLTARITAPAATCQE
jgi:hypothetical protein